jgi:hypothetical protein
MVASHRLFALRLEICLFGIVLINYKTYHYHFSPNEESTYSVPRVRSIRLCPRTSSVIDVTNYRESEKKIHKAAKQIFEKSRRTYS